LCFIQPGNPQQNAYVEGYNRTVRYDWLNQYLFDSVAGVQDYATRWLWTYNNERPNMGFYVMMFPTFKLDVNCMSDVITTASGLKYEILESGSGATPGPTDTVSAHYHGTFEDGRVFDSSVERGQPIDLPVNGVIAGWTEALQMMKEGDKWRLIVTPELGYGANGSGPIPGNTTLVFEVELIAVR
jgi:hypothetical protein